MLAACAGESVAIACMVTLTCDVVVCICCVRVYHNYMHIGKKKTYSFKHSVKDEFTFINLAVSTGTGRNFETRLSPLENFIFELQHASNQGRPGPFPSRDGPLQNLIFEARTADHPAHAELCSKPRVHLSLHIRHAVNTYHTAQLWAEKTMNF